MIEMIEDNEQDRIINEQLQLGQRATLNGMWTRGWVTEQETFLRRIKSRKSPKAWLIKLSILLQNMTHNMWKTRRNEAIHKKEDSALNKQRHEDTFHLFQCPNEEIQKAFEEELEMIKDFLSATTSIANKIW